MSQPSSRAMYFVLVVCGLVSATATAGDEARWAMPRGARIADIKPTMSPGSENDPLTKFCADFTLTEAQVRAFFRHARRITARQMHDQFDWLPCLVTGTLLWGHERANWEISATLVGEVHVRGERILLGCRDQCEQKVFGRTQGP